MFHGVIHKITLAQFFETRCIFVSSKTSELLLTAIVYCCCSWKSQPVEIVCVQITRGHYNNWPVLLL